jgi:regulator of cell morphogenesis and NO signaling
MIMTNLDVAIVDRAATSLRDIVLEDFRTVQVFERHGLDFCCKGDRSLADACVAKGIDIALVEHELEAVTIGRNSGDPRFNNWSMKVLADYIVENHHNYVRSVSPSLLTNTKKVAAVHGANHPEMIRVSELAQTMMDELDGHMRREEEVLFPYIIFLEHSINQQLPTPPSPFGSVRNPINMMMAEHESAGAALEEIRNLTSNYAVPEDACTTFRVTLQQLEEFGQDLHQHVYLENTILFPKAMKLEAST